MDWGTYRGLIITMKYLFRGNEELNNRQSAEGQKIESREYKLEVLVRGDGICPVPRCSHSCCWTRESQRKHHEARIPHGLSLE